MASYVRDVNIFMFPFIWTSEVTSADFDDKAYGQFLDRNGVSGEGMWQREASADQQSIVPYGELDVGWNPFVLPSESAILEDDSVTKEPFTHNTWKDYYCWRGFRLDSIICIILQWPLTIYYILHHCLPVDYPLARQVATDLSATDSNLVIHCVGATKESDLIPAFVELTVLLPHVTFDLHIIGPMLSKVVNGQKLRPSSRLAVTLHSSLYHKVYWCLPKSDVVIGFNAGLVAYTSWIKTLRLLAMSAVPAYFTEYCWKSYELTRMQIAEFGACNFQISHKTEFSEQTRNQNYSIDPSHDSLDFSTVNQTDSVVDQQGGSTKCRTVSVSEARLNPFRSPMRIHDPQTDVPAFSNAVLFFLQY